MMIIAIILMGVTIFSFLIYLINIENKSSKLEEIYKIEEKKFFKGEENNFDEAFKAYIKHCKRI